MICFMVQRSGGKGGKVVGSASKLSASLAMVKIPVAARSAKVDESCVGKSFKVHNGRGFTTIRPTVNMIPLGRKFGELVSTRVFGGHAKKMTKVSKKSR